jgi:NitT/TauT family transport system ATP-binding protein
MLEHTGVGQVELREMTVRFGGKAGALALQPITMSLPAASFTAIVGPSGCGKSTLMNAIAGFVEPTSGSILLDGAAIAGPGPDRSVVFQQYGLFPWFSAAGNVEFALKQFGLSKHDRRAQALAALDEVGLSKMAHRFPGQLSGGMKQRVALARTFAARPKVLLMDEPFGALDAQTRMMMHDVLLRIWAQHRATVLFITHDVEEALVLADTVHVMSSGPGQIVHTVELTEERPRRRESATFIQERAAIVELLRPQAAAAI